MFVCVCLCIMSTEMKKHRSILSGFKMENHGVQCARTVPVRNVSFITRVRRPCDMHVFDYNLRT